MTSEWARLWRLKSPVSRLFTQPFIQAQIKENIKAPRHWPFGGEFTGQRWIPLTKASNAENVSIWWRHHDLTKNITMMHQEELASIIVIKNDFARWCYIYDAMQTQYMIR